MSRSGRCAARTSDGQQSSPCYQHEVTGAPLADLIERGPFPDAHGAEQEAPVRPGR